MANNAPPPTGGFKFNATGSDDTTTQILKPQIAPATVRLRIIVIAAVLCGILLMGYIQYKRNGVPIIPKDEPEHGPVFDAPARTID